MTYDIFFCFVLLHIFVFLVTKKFDKSLKRYIRMSVGYYFPNHNPY